MSILEKKGRVCENCLHEHTGIFEIPCRNCIIETNSLWEPKNDENDKKTD